jgi:photosystem II stability/assembly factor-like uncharacterized protein
MFLTSLLMMALAFCPSPPEQWHLQTSDTKARLRGICAVSQAVVWASGMEGTFVRTTDGGRTWKSSVVAGARALDFRDVHAFDSQTACLLASGAGELSRIERTTDGGQNWTTVFINREPKGFFDALAFWDKARGIALGDPVDGRFQILLTEDGGASWHLLPAASSPPAAQGEGAFAASGTCLVVANAGHAWFGTGGGPAARVFRSSDFGRSWNAAPTPIRCDSPSSGIFSLAFRDGHNGCAIGGDYKLPDDSKNILAQTTDGGASWRLADGQTPRGYRSAIIRVAGEITPTFIATGPNGSEISRNNGATWLPLGIGFHAVSSGGALSATWAVGDDGKIGRLDAK